MGLVEMEDHSLRCFIVMDYAHSDTSFPNNGKLETNLFVNTDGSIAMAVSSLLMSGSLKDVVTRPLKSAF